MEGFERVQYIMDKEGLNKNSFSLAVGISNNVTITRIIKEKRNPSRATCQKIINKFPKYSFDWLFSGEGDINVGNIEVIKEKLESSATPIQQNVVYIPLVNQYAYAGYLDGYSDVTFIDQLPKIPFIVDREGNGSYVAFEVKGDSMNNGTEESYLEGDRLYCREIGQYLWATSKLHLRKWDFVIVHEDGILIKRIIDHDVENHTITIHSLNDMYPDKVIDLCEVRQIFNVIESVRPRRR